MILPWEKPGRQDASRAAEAQMAEAVGLAASIGLVVVHETTVPLRTRRSATLLGQGQIATIGEAIAADKVAVAIVDAQLSPVQQRNLERAWACKVIDRTGLILDIFGERARTKEGAMQVELAHLEYQRSRLVRSWTHLERQRGGFGFLGGPGETQIEADRRLIGDRIVRVKKDLEGVRRTRGLHRSARGARAASRGGPGRLHQRRQVHPVQRADRGRGPRAGPVVRHARSRPCAGCGCRRAAG